MAAAKAPYSIVKALKDWARYKPRSDREKAMVARFVGLYRNRPAADVDERSLVAALADLSPSYYDRIINIVRAALRLAHRHTLIGAVPELPRRGSKVKRERFLRRAEWAELRSHLADHLVAPVEFSLATGLRLSNVTRLQWANVDLQRQVAWVSAIRAKAHEPIPIPLSAPAAAILKRQVGRHAEAVFTYGKKHPRPMGSPKRGFKSALRAAGITDFRWHDLRHSWASWQVMQGTPLRAVQELGGWADISMVQRYAHLSPEHLQSHAGGAAAALGLGKARKPRKAGAASKKRTAKVA